MTQREEEFSGTPSTNPRAGGSSQFTDQGLVAADLAPTPLEGLEAQVEGLRFTDMREQILLKVASSAGDSLQKEDIQDPEARANVLVARTIAALTGQGSFNLTERHNIQIESLRALAYLNRAWSVSLAYALTFEAGPECVAGCLEFLGEFEPRLGALRAVELIDADEPAVRLSALHALVLGDPDRAAREIRHRLADEGEKPEMRSAALELEALVVGRTTEAIAPLAPEIVQNAARLAVALHADGESSGRWSHYTRAERFLAIRKLYSAKLNSPEDYSAYRIGVLAALLAKDNLEPLLCRDVRKEFQILVPELSKLESEPSREQGDLAEPPGPISFAEASRNRPSSRRPVFDSALVAAISSGERPVKHFRHSPEDAKAFEAAISKGELPHQIIEENRIVDPNSETGRAFDSAMQGFFKDLMGKSYDPQKPVRFLLVDSDLPCAFQLKNSQPCTIALSRGMFQAAKGKEPVVATSEDLAWVVLHELFHSNVRETYGPALPVTETEEAAAYWAPLVFMHERGLNPERALITFRKLFVAVKSVGRNLLAEMVDVHPIDENTLSGLETTLGIVRTQRGEPALKKPVIYYSSTHEIVRPALAGRHQAWFDLELGRTPEYASARLERKLEILGEIFPKPELQENIRLYDLGTELEDLCAQITSDEQRQAAIVLAEKILELDIPHGVRWSLYEKFACAANSENRPLPYGRLRALDEKVKAFVEAVEDGDEAQVHSAAQNFIAAVKAEPFAGTKDGQWFLVRLAWSNFEMPDLSKVEYFSADARHGLIEAEDGAAEAGSEPSKVFETPKVDWQNLRELAQKDLEVLKAALLLGFYRDPAIHQAMANFPDFALQIYSRCPPEELRCNLARFSEFYAGYAEISAGPRSRDIHPGQAESMAFEEVPPSLNDITLSNDGRVQLVVSPDRFDDTPHRLGDKESGRVAFRNAKLATLRRITEDSFKELASSPVAEARLNKAGILLAQEDDANRLIYAFDAPPPTTTPLIGLAELSDKTLRQFCRVNAVQLGTIRGATELTNYFRNRLAQGSADARQLVRRFYHLVEDGDGGAIGIMSSVSYNLCRDTSDQRMQRVFSHFTQNPYFAFLRDLDPGLISPLEAYRVLRLYFLGDGFHSADTVGQVAAAEALFEFMRPIALAAGKDQVYTANTWGEFNAILQRPEIQARFAWDKKLPSERGDEVEALSLREEGMTSILLQAKPFLLFDSPDLNAATVLRAARLLRTRWGFSGEARLELCNRIESSLHSVLTDVKLPQAVSNWVTLRKSDLMRVTRAEADLESIVNRIDADSDAKEKVRLSASLLRSGHIVNPELRNRIMVLWARGLREALGADDASPAYGAKFFRVLGYTRPKDKIGSTNSLIDRLDRYALLRLSAKELTAQPGLAKDMQAVNSELRARDYVVLVFGSKIVDVSLEGLRRDPEFRQALIDFLCEPYSEESSATFRRSCATIFRHSGGINPVPHRTIKMPPEDELTDRDRRNIESDKALALRVYRNFWALPLAFRAGIVRELILPQVDDDRTILRETPKEVDQKTFDYVMSKVLPESTPEAEFFRRAIKTWLGHVKPYQMHLVLGALMVAAQSASTHSSIAERLASAGSRMSAFIKKIFQRVPGFPFVDAEFAAPFERLTYEATEEARWDVLREVEARKEQVIDIYNRHLEIQGREKGTDLDGQGRVYIKHYGEVLGSGSIYVTILLTMSNGDRQVMALRRDHVLEAAKDEYEVARLTVADLSDKTTAWQAMQEMLAQVHERLGLEANCRAADAQYELAAELYNGQSIEIDRQTIPFEAVGVSGAGEDFYLMSFAPGRNLIEDLKDPSIPAEERQRLTMAWLTMELHRLFQGRFDYDRTGGQGKRADKLRVMDFKALPIEEWAQAGMTQFGELAVKASLGCGSVQDFIGALLNEEKKWRESGTRIDPFVAEAKMLLLTLARFMKSEYLTPDQIKRSVASAILAGVHPAMADGMLAGLPEGFRELGKRVLSNDSGDTSEVLGMLGLAQSEIVRISSTRN